MAHDGVKIGKSEYVGGAPRAFAEIAGLPEKVQQQIIDNHPDPILRRRLMLQRERAAAAVAVTRPCLRDEDDEDDELFSKAPRTFAEIAHLPKQMQQHIINHHPDPIRRRQLMLQRERAKALPKRPRVSIFGGLCNAIEQGGQAPVALVEPEATVDGEMQIEVEPSLIFAAKKHGDFGACTAYYVARQLDSNGSGWVAADRLKATLLTVRLVKGRSVQRRTVANDIRDGIGIYFSHQDNLGRLWLRGQHHIYAHYDIFSRTKIARVALARFASVKSFNQLADELGVMVTEDKIVSRDTRYAISGVSPASQKVYQRNNRVQASANFGRIAVNDTNRQLAEYLYRHKIVHRAADHIVVQLPNRYQIRASDGAHPLIQRKYRQRHINRKLQDTVWTHPQRAATMQKANVDCRFFGRIEGYDDAARIAKAKQVKRISKAYAQNAILIIEKRHEKHKKRAQRNALRRRQKRSGGRVNRPDQYQVTDTRWHEIHDPRLEEKLT